MEYLVDSLARTIENWCKTSSPLVANTSVGNREIKVLSTRRFKRGDEIIICNSEKGETPLYIDEIIDYQTLRLTSPVKFLWTTTDNSKVEKTFHQMYLQKVYFGEPLNIPKFPAVTVKPVNKSSSFIAFQTTKEVYNLQITLYVEDGNQEDAGRWLCRMADTIERGLKHNFYPLVGPFNTYGLSADAKAGDRFLKLSSTADFWYPSRITLENPWNYEELEVKSVIDSETIELFKPICFDYEVSSNPTVVLTERWIFNSWPSNITYGSVWKGTSLKSATIDWFAWEAQNFTQGNSEPHF